MSKNRGKNTVKGRKVENIFSLVTVHEAIGTKTYNLSAVEQRELRKKHKGHCNICDTHEDEFDKQHAIDHCHGTGTIRGILCARCNIGLGYFKDDPERLRAAAAYLEEVEDGRTNTRSD